MTDRVIICRIWYQDQRIMDDSVCVCSIVKEAVQSISVTQIHGEIWWI